MCREASDQVIKNALTAPPGPPEATRDDVARHDSSGYSKGTPGYTRIATFGPGGRQSSGHYMLVPPQFLLAWRSGSAFTAPHPPAQCYVLSVDVSLGWETGAFLGSVNRPRQGGKFDQYMNTQELLHIKGR